MMNIAKTTPRPTGRIYVAALLISVAIGLSSCATVPRVFSNESPAADFDNYRTYTFAAQLGTDDLENVRSLLSQFLILNVSRQLDSRGYRYTDKDADLIIDFAQATHEKLRSSPTATLGGFYGYGPWPGYGYYGGYGSNYRITQYTEGTLSIALVDAGTNDVVWEGLNIARISDAVRDNMAQAVATAVDEIFARFPYAAPGSSAQPLANNNTNNRQRY